MSELKNSGNHVDAEKVGNAEAEHARALIPVLCRKFYKLGWVSGTGGGMSIRQNERIYVAPSGVQKEAIRSEDIFALDEHGNCVEQPPPCKQLKLSECTPLFMNAYRLRSAGAVIHSHSVNANLITLLFTGKEFRISHQEMIKAIFKGSTQERHRYDDTLIVPIIENTAFERDLTDSMATAINEYPLTNAVLVRRHGIYVWGVNWQAAKTMAESYDYLFDIALKINLFKLEDNLQA